MTTSLRSLTLALALAAASLLGTAAHAQTVIDHLPYTISSSGLYVLNNNLNGTQTSGHLIDINASNVVLDLQDHYIAGPVGNASQNTIGLYAYNRNNITIKNGSVSYCYVGIDLEGNGNTTVNVNHRLDSLRVTHCYYVGIELTSAPAGKVSNCQVSAIGGSSLITGAFGIYATGPGVTVTDNIVSAVAGTTNYNSYGINGASTTLIRSNQIANCYFGISGGKYQNNLTTGCTNPFASGVDAGGNN